ncbi:phosphoenolpyruvate hydrolase family protein [Arsenophonus endosymbiont of Aleurodicus floccissimus]|uniref:phosphoenolpyruvate hydrolase family protein n=1 Tax=Arsenophonus endosymbiont of Aleurodicus floccissimus TaxID=2152761 RepID=UPI003F73105E
MTEAGAYIIVTHMGLTTGGDIGAKTTHTLEDCVKLTNDWAAAAKSVRKDIIVLCHGGPIATPEDAKYILQNCPDCHGFYGTSSMERFPAETAITETTKIFKTIKRK